MKKFFVLLSTMMMFMLSVFAQENVDKTYKHTPEEKAKIKTEKLTKRLQLSQDQATKIEAAMLKRITTRRTNRHTNKNARKEANEAFDASMKSILDDKQYMTYQTTLENKKAKRKDKRHEKRAEKLKNDLNLTDEQVAKVKALLQKHHEARQTLDKNTGDMKAARKEFKNEMRQVLSDEQWETFKAQKKAKRQNRKN